MTATVPSPELERVPDAGALTAEAEGGAAAAHDLQDWGAVSVTTMPGVELADDQPAPGANRLTEDPTMAAAIDEAVEARDNPEKYILGYAQNLLARRAVSENATRRLDLGCQATSDLLGTWMPQQETLRGHAAAQRDNLLELQEATTKGIEVLTERVNDTADIQIALGGFLQWAHRLGTRAHRLATYQTSLGQHVESLVRTAHPQASSDYDRLVAEKQGLENQLATARSIAGINSANVAPELRGTIGDLEARLDGITQELEMAETALQAVLQDIDSSRLRYETTEALHERLQGLRRQRRGEMVQAVKTAIDDYQTRLLEALADVQAVVLPPASTLYDGTAKFPSLVQAVERGDDEAPASAVEPEQPADPVDAPVAPQFETDGALPRSRRGLRGLMGGRQAAE